MAQRPFDISTEGKLEVTAHEFLRECMQKLEHAYEKMGFASQNLLPISGVCDLSPRGDFSQSSIARGFADHSSKTPFPTSINGAINITSSRTTAKATANVQSTIGSKTKEHARQTIRDLRRSKELNDPTKGMRASNPCESCQRLGRTEQCRVALYPTEFKPIKGRHLHQDKAALYAQRRQHGLYVPGTLLQARPVRNGTPQRDRAKLRRGGKRKGADHQAKAQGFPKRA
ncbi:hypothetical protein F4775DRAFT_607590 [Biscogniauxia sp. FL1348]|nr:hypothetical protein F4775DRAFT_607590 [Biscogniauxia sp. FL1348]